MKKVFAVLVTGLLFQSNVSAGNLEQVTNIFASGSKASAGEVNKNFEDVVTEVNDNAGGIGENAGAIEANSGNISSNATAIDTKQTAVNGSCPAGSYIRVINSDGTVVCQADNNSDSGGDITGIVTSAGLTGGSDTGTVTLGIDPAQVQTRLANGCAAGEVMQSVSQNGAVICVADSNSGGDITSVQAGAGISVAGGDSGTATVSIGNDAITGAMLGPDSVDTSEISANAVQSDLHIADEAGITVEQRCSITTILGTIPNPPPCISNITTITSTGVNVSQVTILPPGPGSVLVTFTGRYGITHAVGTTDNLGIAINTTPTPTTCTTTGGGGGIGGILSRVTTCDSSYMDRNIIAAQPAGTYTGSLSTQKMFTVTSSTPVTYYVDAKSSGSTSVNFRNYNMSVIYFPTSY